MSDQLRKDLIRVAHSLPAGSEERKKVLALLKESTEFPTEEALKQYLKEHPKADPKQHTVKKDDKGDEGKDEGKKEISKEQAAAAKGLKDALNSSHAKRIKPETREKLTKALEQMEETGSPPDDIRKTFRDALDSLLPARKIPAVKEFMTTLKSKFKDLDVPAGEAPKPKPDLSKYKGRGIIAPPERGGVGKPYRRRAMQSEALRIASRLPKGDPKRRRILEALQGKTARSLDCVDSYDLLEFGKAYCGLGNAVQEQLHDLMTLDERQWAGINPNALRVIQRARLDRMHDEIAEAIASYEEWLETGEA